MKRILGLFIVWFAIINLFGLVALNRLNVAPDTAYGWIDPIKTTVRQSWNFLDSHYRWDSGWYRGIVEQGYYWDEKAGLSNIVFFPLYPMLSWALTQILFGHFLLAAWLISIASLLGAVLLFHKLVKEFEAKADPELAVVFLLIFPTAIFFNSIYTESLFLLLSIGSFYFTFKRKYWIAGALVFLACLTRVTGILLFVPLAIEYYVQEKERHIISHRMIPLLLAPLGTIGFLYYHYIKFGDFFLFFNIEKAWGRAFNFNPEHFTTLTHAASTNLLLDTLFVLFTVVLIFLVAKRLRVSYAVYMVMTLGVALSTGTLMSIGRYIAVLFPIYIFASSMRSTLAKQTWALISILLLALYTMLFVHFHWAG